MDAGTRTAVAESLVDAYATKRPLDPLSATYPDLTLEDAYAIQLLQVDHWVASGRRIVGHKVGLTSRAMQRMLGVDQPDYGHLTDDMVHLEHLPIDSDRFLQPRVEPEVAFVLKHALTGPGVTVAEAIAAVDFVLPALEIIDSRIRDWRIGLLDTIADNASSAGFVLGPQRVSPKDIDICAIDAVLTRNGEVVAEGRSDAVLGNPVTAVAWLARKVDGFGVRLKAGDIVLPGSCTRAIDARPGDAFVADFAGLGSVRLSFE